MTIACPSIYVVRRNRRTRAIASKTSAAHPEDEKFPERAARQPQPPSSSEPLALAAGDAAIPPLFAPPLAPPLLPTVPPVPALGPVPAVEVPPEPSPPTGTTPSSPPPP